MNNSKNNENGNGRLSTSISGAKLIMNERIRQVTDKGWSAHHDDQHDLADFILASHAYSTAGAAAAQPTNPKLDGKGYRPNEGSPVIWPWELSAWKPSDDPIRNLEKAGALIAAAIDKLQRAKDRNE